jgi:hypothetical protein
VTPTQVLKTEEVFAKYIRTDGKGPEEKVWFPLKRKEKISEKLGKPR